MAQREEAAGLVEAVVMAATRTVLRIELLISMDIVVMERRGERGIREKGKERKRKGIEGKGKNQRERRRGRGD